MNVVADPLLLGQRVIAILETGQCDATYKLATLMALIDHCIENLPDRARRIFSACQSRNWHAGPRLLLAPGSPL